MRHKAITGLAIVLFSAIVAACSPGAGVTPDIQRATSAPTALEPDAVQAPEVVPSNTPGTGDTAYLETVDLTAFAEAWSAGDIEQIRALYAPDATYLSAEEVVALHHGPLPVQVGDEAFAERVRERQGLTMKILGEPIQVFDKLVGFPFRWQDGSSGFDGVALLRYEGGLIWMHTYATSPERTPNPPDEPILEPVDLDALMEAWSAGDAQAVRSFYTNGAGVFNDEDIAQSLRGRVLSAQQLAGGHLAGEVVGNGGEWGMTAVGQPVRIGDLVLSVWSWKAFDYPLGYGIRLLRYDGDKIDTDIRYAIRPWEARGETFMSGL
jgi:ketosteroid isomerase-like protein